MFKKIATYTCMLLVGIMGFFINFSSFGNIASSGIVANTYAACGDVGAPACPPTPPDDATQKMLQSLVNGLNIVLDILTIIVTPAMILASWLMSPDWTSGDLFQIRPMIHDLWVTVANIAYFIYAILLVFIALATIFNSAQYGYKQLLPKLALGIIMVPLTWWFVQFIVSLATIVTASVINIPIEVVISQQKGQANNWWTTDSIPVETRFENGTTTVNGVTMNGASHCGDGKICISPEKFINSAGGMYSSLMIYSHAIFRFQDVKRLSSSGKDAIKTIGQLINQALVGSVMFIVFGLLVMSLIFMLLVRAVKLWFYAIFSPLMTLKYVLGDKMFKDSADSFDLKEFIGLAFVPAIVGLALSFGLIIVSVMLKPIPSPDTTACNGTSCSITMFGNPANTLTTATTTGTDAKTTTTAEVGGIKYIFVGDVTSGNTTNAVNGALNLTGGIIGTVIIDIIALVFIWVAFMAAKGVSKVAKAAFEPFEAIGTKIGGMAMSLPKYAPILPGGVSMKGAEKVISNAENYVQLKHDKEFKASKAGKLFGGENIVSEADEKMLSGALSNVKTGTNAYQYKEVQQTLGRNAGKDTEYSNMFSAIAKHLKEQNYNDIEKMAALKSMGYSENNAKTIMETLRDKTGGEFDRNNRELVAAFKSNAGTSSSGVNNAAAFTANKVVGDDNKIVVSFNDQNIQFNIKDGTYKDIDKVNIEKMITGLTEDEFRKKSSGISDTIREKIILDMKDKFKKL